jgi:hypothetical protein
MLKVPMEMQRIPILECKKNFQNNFLPFGGLIRRQYIHKKVAKGTMSKDRFCNEELSVETKNMSVDEVATSKSSNRIIQPLVLNKHPDILQLITRYEERSRQNEII